jgi:hypothetical protein
MAQRAASRGYANNKQSIMRGRQLAPRASRNLQVALFPEPDRFDRPTGICSHQKGYPSNLLGNKHVLSDFQIGNSPATITLCKDRT